ncbi:tail fibers [Aeromonas phage 32]|nr:tail fibers [Aeromonas phage 32]
MLKIEILGASAPAWANEEQTAITLTVRFGHYPQPLTFTAVRDDREEHGRELWSRAIHGEFGEIGPYTGMTKEQEEMATFPLRQRVELERLEKLITPLARAVKFKLATPEEEAELEALERHTVAVMQAKGPTLPGRV